MKLLPLLPYLFDGTITKIYDENSVIVLNEEGKYGRPCIEFRYPDGELQEPDLQELTEDDLNDDDWCIKRSDDSYIDLNYYKAFPLLVGIEKLLSGEIDLHVYRTLLGFQNLRLKRIDGTKVLCLEYGDGDIDRLVLDQEIIESGRI